MKSACIFCTMSKYALISDSFYTDSTATLLSPEFSALQPTAQARRTIQPITQTSGNIVGSHVQFLIPKQGHYVEELEFRANVSVPGPGVGESHTYNPFFFEHVIDRIEYEYNGTLLETEYPPQRLTHYIQELGDETQYHEAVEQGGGAVGLQAVANSDTEWNLRRVYTNTAAANTWVLSALLRPWCLALTGNSLPVAIIDNEVRVIVYFSTNPRILSAASAGAAAATLSITQPYLVGNFIDVPNNHLQSLSELRTISWPQEQYQEQIFTVPANTGQTTFTFQINGITGLVQRVTVDAYLSTDYNGTTVGNNTLYNRIESDPNLEITFWDMTANGEKIMDKVPQDTRYNRGRYRRKHLVHNSRKYLQTPANSTHRNGKLMYTWGQGARSYADLGTGHANFDELSAIELHLTFAASPAAPFTVVFAAYKPNVVTLTRGVLTRQLV
jgi:hypothetical protein